MGWSPVPRWPRCAARVCGLGFGRRFRRPCALNWLASGERDCTSYQPLSTGPAPAVRDPVAAENVRDALSLPQTRPDLDRSYCQPAVASLAVSRGAECQVGGIGLRRGGTFSPCRMSGGSRHGLTNLLTDSMTSRIADVAQLAHQGGACAIPRLVARAPTPIVVWARRRPGPAYR